jgi:hypothetical protein
MKHIATILIFGALSLQGCGENPKQQVSTNNMYEVKEVQTETSTSTPDNKSENSAAVVPATTPVRKQVRHNAKPRTERRAQPKVESRSAMVNDEVTSGRAAPVIQAQEEEVLFQDKTYNELQISDDANDYPLSPESIRLEMQTYM